MNTSMASLYNRGRDKLALERARRTTVEDGLGNMRALAGRLIPGAAITHYNLLIPDFSPGRRFAGILTALQFGDKVARKLGVPLRVLTTDFIPPRLIADYRRDLQSLLSSPDATVDSLLAGTVLCSPTDLWQATYWTTAVILDIAARSGAISAQRVAYLVQDYEPNFFAWSTQAALAQSTYHAGFAMAVNSRPLRDYLHREEGVRVSDDLTFAPELDYKALERVHDSRLASSHKIGIFFYARPNKPRNLFPIGAAALQVFDTLWATHPLAKSVEVTVTSAGDESPHLELANVKQTVLGKTTYAGYFDLLSRSAVSLSLMMSPHPSHPPLESAVSGGLSVTNSFGAFRDELHPSLILAAAQPDELGAAVLQAVVRSLAEGPQPFARIQLAALGGSMAGAAAAMASLLSASGSGSRDL